MEKDEETRGGSYDEVRRKQTKEEKTNGKERRKKWKRDRKDRMVRRQKGGDGVGRTNSKGRKMQVRSIFFFLKPF